MTASPESDLRRLVREVILEVLPQADAGNARPDVRPVNIRSSKELGQFVEDVMRLAADHDEVARYRAGTLRFAWAPESQLGNGSLQADDISADAAAGTVSSSPQPTGPVLHIETGAVTERLVTQALAQGSRVTMGKRAVVTPLGRELARRNGLVLEREA